MFGGPRLVRRPLGIIHVTDVYVVFRLRRHKLWLSRAPGYLGTRDEKSGLTVSGSGGFRLLTRSRAVRRSAFRFCWPAAVSRYLSWAFRRDHFRAAARHPSLQ